MRKRLAKLEGNHCFYCGAKEERLTLDHMLPISHGGRSGIRNLVLACRQCNSKKANRSLVEHISELPQEIALLVRMKLTARLYARPFRKSRTR